MLALLLNACARRGRGHRHPLVHVDVRAEVRDRARLPRDVHVYDVVGRALLDLPPPRPGEDRGGGWVLGARGALGIGYVEYLVSGITVEVPDDWFLRLARSWLESNALRPLSYTLALLCLFASSNLDLGVAGLVVARRRETRNALVVSGALRSD
ncbi:MAG: hypothetical protein AAF602_23020 [Myxococcota bacterium]